MKRAVLLSLLLLPGCTTVRGQLDRESVLIDNPARDWRIVATAADRTRLRNWRADFTSALAAALSSGSGSRIAAEGLLLAPDAALPGPALADGAYRCRTIKLGARAANAPAYRVLPSTSCRIRPERGLQSLVIPGGAQRPIGMIFPGDPLRSVFIGTLNLGDERRALQYSSDPDRDMVGYVERIGTRRWRLILPRPHFDSLFDVVEITPA